MKHFIFGMVAMALVCSIGLNIAQYKGTFDKDEYANEKAVIQALGVQE